jgi:endonuclease/exonuclease/phosphatase family metal-dependent hydrolase
MLRVSRTVSIRGALGVGLLTLVVLAAVWWYARLHRPSPAQSRHLKVITYNVQFLPGLGRLFNKRPDVEYRARTLARLLAVDCDLIALTEVFDEGPRELLLDGLRDRLGDSFHCVTAPPAERSAFGVDSGLVLVSRLPILGHHSLKYGNDSGVWKHGPLADGFAAKGALHARLGRGNGAPPDDFVDVFLTHLESYDPASREAQYALLARFVHEYGALNRPALVVGDFNTDGRPGFMKDPASPYRRMMTTLQGGRPGCGLTDVWPLFWSDPGGTSEPDSVAGGERIDYVFVSNPGDGRAALRPVDIRVNRFLDDKVTSLSDHSAVEADLHWEPQPR